MDPTKVQTAHPPNIAGVRPGTGPYKSSDNTSTKYNGFTPIIFGGCVV
jgi:hypothetical protein